MTDQTPPPTSPPPSPSPWHDRPPLAPRKAYLIRSTETWDLVRRDYLRGDSAAVVAERYGVSAWNIRRRAQAEGWTRRAHAAATEAARRDGLAALSVDPSDPAAPSLALHAAPAWPQDDLAAPLDPFDGEPDAVGALALAAAARALRTGRYADAERLGRLAETLTKLSPAPKAAAAESAKNEEEEEEPDWRRGKAYLHMPRDYDTGGHDRQKFSLILTHLIEVGALQLLAKTHEEFERFYGEIREAAGFLAKLRREGAAEAKAGEAKAGEAKAGEAKAGEAASSP